MNTVHLHQQLMLDHVNDLRFGFNAKDNSYQANYPIEQQLATTLSANRTATLESGINQTISTTDLREHTSSHHDLIEIQKAQILNNIPGAIIELQKQLEVLMSAYAEVQNNQIQMSQSTYDYNSNRSHLQQTKEAFSSLNQTPQVHYLGHSKTNEPSRIIDHTSNLTSSHSVQREEKICQIQNLVQNFKNNNASLSSQSRGAMSSSRGTSIGNKKTGNYIARKQHQISRHNMTSGGLGCHSTMSINNSQETSNQGSFISFNQTNTLNGAASAGGLSIKNSFVGTSGQNQLNLMRQNSKISNQGCPPIHPQIQNQGNITNYYNPQTIQSMNYGQSSQGISQIHQPIYLGGGSQNTSSLNPSLLIPRDRSTSDPNSQGMDVEIVKKLYLQEYGVHTNDIMKLHSFYLQLTNRISEEQVQDEKDLDFYHDQDEHTTGGRISSFSISKSHSYIQKQIDGLKDTEEDDDAYLIASTSGIKRDKSGLESTKKKNFSANGNYSDAPSINSVQKYSKKIHPSMKKQSHEASQSINNCNTERGRGFQADIDDNVSSCSSNQLTSRFGTEVRRQNPSQDSVSINFGHNLNLQTLPSHSQLLNPLQAVQKGLETIQKLSGANSLLPTSRVKQQTLETRSIERTGATSPLRDKSFDIQSDLSPIQHSNQDKTPIIKLFDSVANASESRSTKCRDNNKTSTNKKLKQKKAQNIEKLKESLTKFNINQAHLSNFSSPMIDCTQSITPKQASSTSLFGLPLPQNSKHKPSKKSLKSSVKIHAQSNYEKLFSPLVLSPLGDREPGEVIVTPSKLMSNIVQTSDANRIEEEKRQKGKYKVNVKTLKIDISHQKEGGQPGNDQSPLRKAVQDIPVSPEKKFLHSSEKQLEDEFGEISIISVNKDQSISESGINIGQDDSQKLKTKRNSKERKGSVSKKKPNLHQMISLENQPIIDQVPVVDINLNEAQRPKELEGDEDQQDLEKISEIAESQEYSRMDHQGLVGCPGSGTNLNSQSNGFGNQKNPGFGGTLGSSKQSAFSYMNPPTKAPQMPSLNQKLKAPTSQNNVLYKPKHEESPLKANDKKSNKGMNSPSKLKSPNHMSQEQIFNSALKSSTLGANSLSNNFFNNDLNQNTMIEQSPAFPSISTDTMTGTKFRPNSGNNLNTTDSLSHTQNVVVISNLTGGSSRKNSQISDLSSFRQAPLNSEEVLNANSAHGAPLAFKIISSNPACSKEVLKGNDMKKIKEKTRNSTNKGGAFESIDTSTKRKRPGTGGNRKSGSMHNVSSAKKSPLRTPQNPSQQLHYNPTFGQLHTQISGFHHSNGSFSKPTQNTNQSQGSFSNFTFQGAANTSSHNTSQTSFDKMKLSFRQPPLTTTHSQKRSQQSSVKGCKKKSVTKKRSQSKKKSQILPAQSCSQLKEAFNAFSTFSGEDSRHFNQLKSTDEPLTQKNSPAFRPREIAMKQKQSRLMNEKGRNKIVKHLSLNAEKRDIRDSRERGVSQSCGKDVCEAVSASMRRFDKRIMMLSLNEQDSKKLFDVTNKRRSFSKRLSKGGKGAISTISIYDNDLYSDRKDNSTLISGSVVSNPLMPNTSIYSSSISGFNQIFPLPQPTHLSQISYRSSQKNQIIHNSLQTLPIRSLPQTQENSGIGTMRRGAGGTQQTRKHSNSIGFEDIEQEERELIDQQELLEKCLDDGEESFEISKMKLIHKATTQICTTSYSQSNVSQSIPNTYNMGGSLSGDALFKTTNALQTKQMSRLMSPVDFPKSPTNNNQFSSNLQDKSFQQNNEPVSPVSPVSPKITTDCDKITPVDDIDHQSDILGLSAIGCMDESKISAINGVGSNNEGNDSNFFNESIMDEPKKDIKYFKIKQKSSNSSISKLDNGLGTSLNSSKLRGTLSQKKLQLNSIKLAKPLHQHSVSLIKNDEGQRSRILGDHAIDTSSILIGQATSPLFAHKHSSSIQVRQSAQAVPIPEQEEVSPIRAVKEVDSQENIEPNLPKLEESSKQSLYKLTDKCVGLLFKEFIAAHQSDYINGKLQKSEMIELIVQIWNEKFKSEVNDLSDDQFQAVHDHKQIGGPMESIQSFSYYNDLKYNEQQKMQVPFQHYLPQASRVISDQ